MNKILFTLIVVAFCSVFITGLTYFVARPATNVWHDCTFNPNVFGSIEQGFDGERLNVSALGWPYSYAQNQNLHPDSNGLCLMGYRTFLDGTYLMADLLIWSFVGIVPATIALKLRTRNE